MIALGSQTVCLFDCFSFSLANGDAESLGKRPCERPHMGRLLSFAAFYVRVCAPAEREFNLSPSSSPLLVASHRVCSSEPPLRSSASSHSSVLPLFLFGWVKRPVEADDSPRLRREPTVGIVSEPETIFTAALTGLPGNKASIDPPNEPTQQSLLLDLYLLKSGEEKSSSFSTFRCILSAY